MKDAVEAAGEEEESEYKERLGHGEHEAEVDAAHEEEADAARFNRIIA